MYNVDPTLLERIQSKNQTKINNNDPSPQVYITRNKTAISSQRFWDKRQVTPTVGTRSSIAVRRPEGNLTGGMIFVAQVEDGNAVIRKAEPRINLTNMVWSHVMTINDVSELSIMFDGYMKMVEGKVESYTTGNLPIVFYVDSDNSLKGWNMNNDIQFTISDTAYNVASVRGLYSEAADLNDGIFVFYTNAEGELWEARVLNDEVTELTQITLKPEGVTGWEDVWASLTFDWRIVLQLKGDDGNVYTLLSSSRPSGFSLIETFDYGLKVKERMMFQCGEEPPILYSIFNSPEEPLKVKLTFDSEVFVFDPSPAKVWMQGSDGQKRYPQSIVKTGERELTLIFGSDLIGLRGPQALKDDKYKPCGFGSNGVSAKIDQVYPTLFDVDFYNAGNDIFRCSIKVADRLSLTIDAAFDGNSYHTETLNCNLIVKTPLAAQVIQMIAEKAYSTETFPYSLSVKGEIGLALLNSDGTPI